MIEILRVSLGYCVGESGSYEVSYESIVVQKRDKSHLEQSGSCGGGKMRLSSGYILKGEWERKKQIFKNDTQTFVLCNCTNPNATY